MGGTGTAVLWFPARVVRARPFSGSQHEQCEHGRSLVPNTGGASTAILWFPARAVRARPFSGSQHRWSVAWRRSAALLQAKEEEEEDKGEKRRAWPGGGALRCCRREKRRRTEERKEEEKRREILIGTDQDQNLFFSVTTFLCFQTRSFVFGFLSLALLRKLNRETKA